MNEYLHMQSTHEHTKLTYLHFHNNIARWKKSDRGSSHFRHGLDLRLDFEDCEKSRLTFESLAGIVKAIKTSLCTDDLYGTELIAGIKIASYSKASFDAVLPLYENFCCKKSQDRLLEEFYGLILDASTYLNCPNSHATNVIMIEIPNRLAAFFQTKIKT